MYHNHPQFLKGKKTKINRHILQPIFFVSLHPVFYLTCEMAGVHYAKQNDMRDWGIEQPKSVKKIPSHRNRQIIIIGRTISFHL